VSIKADVAIIGGGVIGASIAYRLAQAGKKVVLFEKYDFAAGATGSCDQCVFLQSKNPGIHLKLALDSSEIFQNLAKELDYTIDYFQHGGMITIENEMEMRVMSDFVEKQSKLGLDVCIISRDEAAKRQRGLAKHLLGCTYSPTDGHVNPFKLTLGFIQAAKKLGAEFYIDAEVTAFRQEGGRIKGINQIKKELRSMVKSAKYSEGKKAKGASLEELFNSEFMREYTDFESYEELLAASGLTAESTEVVNAAPDGELDLHVRRTTRFSSWLEMQDTAANEYVIKKLGF